MRALFLVALLSACGAPARVSPMRMDTIVDRAGGAELVVLPRATEGRMWLSLWIDAGSRDAEPPQVATVAAWIAAGEGVSTEVLPDGIELTLACEREALDGCLRSLAMAASARRPAASAVHDARRRLAGARTRAHADETRRADAIAMQALLGRSVDPLGDAEDDARVSEHAVGAFLEEHVGAGRLLLVAVGDVDPAELRERVEGAFGAVPEARAPRGVRSPPEARAVRAEVGERGLIAAATLRPSVHDALRQARAVVARVEADRSEAGASADVFPLRGGAALIARSRADGAALLDHLTELASAPPLEGDDPAPPAEGPRALARWIGARWVAEQEAPLSGGLGVGAIVAGGRGDRIDERDPDLATREQARRALEARLAERPLGEGTIDDERAELTLRGARISARRLSGASQVSAVVLFEGGSADDPAATHGATALLAEVAGSGCELVALRELGETPAALGVRVEPILRPSEWGIAVEGPARRWREIAFLATRCASVPYLEPASIDRARESIVALVERPREAARAIAAHAIAPGAPGRIAPLGRTDALGRVGARELRRARASRVATSRARIAIAGDMPIEGAARVLARGASRWPEGSPREADPWADPSARLSAARHPEGRHEALVAWVIEAPEGASVASSAFTRAAIEALDGEPGLSARWSEAGASGGRAWALCSLDATPDALDRLPAHVARAISTISWGDVAARAAHEAEEGRAWAEASPRGVATALASGAPAPQPREEVQRLLTSLAESAPYFVILRPQPGSR